MPLEFIDYSKSKREFNSINQQWITSFRCKCACCRTCWFRPDIDACSYAGPYDGYVSVDQEDTRG